MNDKEKIKFAIRYLKQGLKSKRTPPLYESLMNELGFEYTGNGNSKTQLLTEAKALLTRFVMVSIYLNGKEQDLVKEAEQFLKENR